MRAVCVRHRSHELADHQRGRFAEFDMTYDLTPGRTYFVAGMGIWEAVLQVLVQDDSGLPAWCPAALFEIEVQPVPSDWRFVLRSGAQASGRELWTRWVAQWGYAELTDDEGHSDELQERRPGALDIFNREVERSGAGGSGSR